MWLLSILTLLIATSIVTSQEWNYNTSSPYGPANWYINYPTCTGTKQSPIDIQTLTRSVKYFPDWVYTNYDSTEGHYIVMNNGHAVEVEVETEIKVSGAELPGTYRLAQFHFHWGSVDTRGSEHLVDNKPYAMEIHFVHYNEIYPNTSAALADPEGVAVLGVLVKIGAFNAALDPIVQQLANITQEGESATINAIAIDTLLPTSRIFYRYNGGLTTPGCTESVIWSVFKTNIEISSAQMAEFRALQTHMETSSTQGYLVDNYRPSQSLNSRTVYESSATGLKAVYALTLVSSAFLVQLFV